MTSIPQGMVFLVTHGAYADFSVDSLLRAKEALNVEELYKKFLIEKNVSDREIYQQGPFLSWLKEQVDLVEVVTCVTLHLGDYSMFDPRIEK